jgi:2-oxoisovalerate dehydrogenase E1 component
VRTAPPFDKKGMTFLERVMHGVGDALDADPRRFVFGEDVGGKYGNAFLLLRPLLDEFGDRIINSPLAEGRVLGVLHRRRARRQRPIGEMQFNDFVATGFNQLVNNARQDPLPLGRQRADGRAHAVGRSAPRRAVPRQNTEPWFYRTPGLKIVVPSTPSMRAR